MANELKHTAVGGTLTQAEYETVLSHIFNSQATGDIMYASSPTQLSRLGIGTAAKILVSDGTVPSWADLVFIGDGVASNAFMTTGITLDQGTADDEIISLKSSDVAHGMTTITETDTYARFIKQTAADGGLSITGLKDVGSSTPTALALQAASATNADTTKSTAARGLVEVFGSIKSGTSWGAVNADGNVFVVRAFSTSVFILDEDGDLWLNATGKGLTLASSADSALVADEVSLGGFDIAPGERSLAISQENPVVTEAIGASDRTLPVRINGANYKILLKAV